MLNSNGPAFRSLVIEWRNPYFFDERHCFEPPLLLELSSAKHVFMAIDSAAARGASMGGSVEPRLTPEAPQVHAFMSPAATWLTSTRIQR